MSAVPVKDKIEYTVSLVTDFAKNIHLLQHKLLIILTDLMP